MINRQIVYLGALYLAGMTLRAEMPMSEYKILSQSFQTALKYVDIMSSDQLLKLADWADAISSKAALLGLEEEVPESLIKAPDYTKTVFFNHSNDTVMVQSPAQLIPYMKTLDTPDENERPTKKFKIDPQVVKKLPFGTSVNNEIYVHVIYGDNYFENYISHKDRIDIAEAMKELRLAHPRARHNTLQKRLMLRVEINFRNIIRKNPELIKVTKYVGLTENDNKRAPSHGRDMNNELKVIGSTKAKYLRAVLDSGYNVRMNALLYNVPKADLPLYEALMADIFPVQIFGCSARIADNKSKQFLIEYKKWNERVKVLKYMGLLNIVEQLIRTYLPETLPENLSKNKQKRTRSASTR